ncbi:MAG: hypothetical protein ACKVTZ_00460 [Bacteroidia bacterium]
MPQNPIPFQPYTCSFDEATSEPGVRSRTVNVVCSLPVTWTNVSLSPLTTSPRSLGCGDCTYTEVEIVVGTQGESTEEMYLYVDSVTYTVSGDDQCTEVFIMIPEVPTSNTGPIKKKSKSIPGNL